jgi:hypothetical protein
MIKTTVANQNPSKNGDPIGFIDVIYTKFLSCLTALDAEMLFFCE